MASMRAVMFRRTLHMPYRASLTSTSRPVTHSSSLSSSRAAFHHAPRRPQNDRFRSRLGDALNKTKIQWKPIPIGLGIGFLGLFQFYRTQTRENDNSLGNGDRPSKRERVKPDGPWQVQVMSTLPLKAISRLWGRFNEIPIPYYLRIPGFKLYSWIFGVNLDEVAEPDLHVFPNLASFFYRKIKDGSRPLDPSPDALISPADGRVLQFGKVVGGDIEQVKGMTYSVDALLGTSTPPASIVGDSEEVDDRKIELHGDEKLVKQDEEFAQVNGISYTIPDLIGGSNKESHLGRKVRDQTTRPSSPGAVADVRAELALGEKPWYDLLSEEKKNSLYYAVVYLAPGDYHRFHSPANWVVERRRHFAGELYSVSPYLQRTLPGLFTLNERVALIGRWRWGFFSYVPVGATNVGSIVVNFDEELRTNSLLTDTEADRAAAEAKARGEPYSGFAEATYSTASRVLGGHALRRGDEMGGFKLGSTIVLVFEAPAAENPAAKGGFRWAVEMGQKVKMGQALGYVEE